MGYILLAIVVIFVLLFVVASKIMDATEGEFLKEAEKKRKIALNNKRK